MTHPERMSAERPKLIPKGACRHESLSSGHSRLYAFLRCNRCGKLLYERGARA